MSSVFRNQGRSPGNEIEKRKVMIFAFLDKGGGTRSYFRAVGQVANGFRAENFEFRRGMSGTENW